MAVRPTPDLVLERMLLDELPAAPTLDGADAARLAAMRSSNEEILARYPARVVAVRISERARAPREGRGWVFAGPAVAVALVALISVLPAPVPVDGVVEDDGIRLKGMDPHLTVHRVTESGVESLSDGAAATAGDLLQLSYVAGDAAYGVVLSIDGRGTVTVHHPLGGGPAAPLDPDGAIALPSSYALDDAPAFERFYLVTAAAPFAVAAIEAAAERAAKTGASQSRLDLPHGLEQSSFLVVKRGNP